MPQITTFATLSGQSADANGNIFFCDDRQSAVFGVHVVELGSGRVRFEGTLDGENFALIEARSLANGFDYTSTSVSGIFRIEARGLAGIRTPHDLHSAGRVRVLVLPQT